MSLRPAHLIAAGISLALAGWLASGQLSAGLTEPDDAAATRRAEAPAPFAVRTSWSRAQPIRREIKLNGWTEPARDVELRAETHGRVVEVGVSRGRRVEADAVLLRLDPRERRAMVRQAEAALRQRQLEHEAATKLGQKGFQAETKVAGAEAALEAARAELERARLDLEHTTIEAPFAGILELRPVEVGDYVDVGDPVAMLLDTDPLIVAADVAETEIGRFELGMAGDATLISGDLVQGRIGYIASRADPATRTFRVELEVPNPAGDLPTGMSAELGVATGEVPAHPLPASLLALDDQGRLGIKSVTGDGRVRFFEAEIVRADGERVWLAGLPDELQVITVGQGFVRDGDPVRPVDDGRIEPSPLVAERRR